MMAIGVDYNWMWLCNQIKPIETQEMNIHLHPLEENDRGRLQYTTFGCIHGSKLASRYKLLQMYINLLVYVHVIQIMLKIIN